MRLLDSPLYNADLKKAVGSMDFSLLDGKTFFVTGGLGLIASTIVDVLLTYGKTGTIYIGARNKARFEKRYGNLERVRFVSYDALKPLKLEIVPDYIIHGAGLASPEQYTLMPVETILSNIDGIHELLHFAKNNPVERVLYISSSEVYGKKSTEKPFVEDQYGEVDIDNIRLSYAVAKRASEMICKAYASEYEEDIVIVRPGHIFGPSAKKDDKRISSDFVFKAAMGKKLEMKNQPEYGVGFRTFDTPYVEMTEPLTKYLINQKKEMIDIQSLFDFITSNKKTVKLSNNVTLKDVLMKID